MSSFNHTKNEKFNIQHFIDAFGSIDSEIEILTGGTISGGTETPNITIGTVTTGNAGTNASASITGTTPNLALNLTIPKGIDGATGATGATGNNGVGIPGVGIPTGGTSGQVLSKNSLTDYDTSWTTPTSGGGGSTVVDSTTNGNILINNVETKVYDDTSVVNGLTNIVSQKGVVNGIATLGSDGKLTSTQLPTTASTNVIVNKNKLAITGDSITEMNKSGKGLGYTSTSGYIDWGNLLTSHAFNVIYNDGVSGNKIADVASRFDANIIALNADFIHIMIGVNDIGATGETVATITAGLLSLYTKALNSGAILIIGTITPTNSFTASNLIMLTTVNGWIREYARNNHNVILVDYYSCVADSTTGLPKTGYTTDGTHPNCLMAYVMGNCFKNAVTPYVKSIYYGSGFAVDASNILTNAAFNGTTSATGWSFSGTNTKTIVPSNDYIDSKYQSVDITDGNYVELSQSVNLATGKVAIGDTVFSTVDVNIASMTNFSVVFCKVQVYNASFAIIAQAYEFTDPQTTVFPISNFSATLVTPKIVVPAGASNVTIDIKVMGTGNVKFRNPSIIKI